MSRHPLRFAASIRVHPHPCPVPVLAAMAVVSIAFPVRAADGNGSSDGPVAGASIEEPTACSPAEVEGVRQALRSEKDRTRQCASLKAKHGDGFSYAEFMYGRYRTKFTAGVFLAAAGAGLALAAVGTGIAWSQTPQEDGPDSGPFFSLRLSERDKYKVATLVLAPVSLALLVSGALTLAIVRPTMLRLEEIVSDAGNRSIRSLAVVFEPFVDARGSAGGRLRISF
ncbi:MAG TPA: hypothetical protein VM389_14755 [Phycisphaerae bacterium]|nr:hypothetical protein [Phycisphaerae bacterium]